MSQKVLDFEASLVKAYKGVYVIDSLRNMHELIIDNWQLSVDLLDQVQECAAAPVSKFLVSGAAGHELYKTNKQFKHLMDAGGGYGTPYAFCFHKKKNPGYSEGVLAFAKTVRFNLVQQTYLPGTQFVRLIHRLACFIAGVQSEQPR